MNDNGQWVMLMGFLISIALIFLMVIINQATLVGQTTAEGVLEFPKYEIRDLRTEVIRSVRSETLNDEIYRDIRVISLKRNHAIVSIGSSQMTNLDAMMVRMRFNNGVTVYEETLLV